MFIAILLLLTPPSRSFSGPTPNESSRNGLVSRRDSWKISFTVFAGVAYAKLVSDVVSRLARGLEYPEPHERRIKSTLTTALTTASAGGEKKVLRVLEAGIGSDCRLIRRGLYNNAFQHLKEQGVSKIELVGVDLKRPSDQTIHKAKEVIADAPLLVRFDVVEGDVSATSLPFRQGYFDAVVCCLTLCSVADQTSALANMRDLIRPGGGVFAYVEHVAVDPDEPYRFLEFQQTTLDPIQQLLAGNCHLHRYTDQAIASVFGLNEAQATFVARERFLVDSMWPVSCQSAGVIQRVAAS
jgi:SAM-dependent methyltransferase